MSKFVSTQNKGFNMTFENGISISVQWGVGNYCNRKNDGEFGEPMKGEFWEATSAEIMIRDTNNNPQNIDLGNGDSWLQVGYMLVKLQTLLMHVHKLEMYRILIK